MNKKIFSLCSIGLLVISCFPISAFSESITDSSSAPSIVEESQETMDSSEEATAETEESATEETEISSETQETTTETTTTSTDESQLGASPETRPSFEENETGASTERAPEIPEKAAKNDSSAFSDRTIIKTKDTEAFILSLGEQARTVAQEHDLFASIMLAQAILESGSGTSKLSQEPHYNLFGIKGEYEGQKVVFSTYEDSDEGYYKIEAAFRSYPSYEASFEDYAKLLKQGVLWNEHIYQNVWKSQAGTYQHAAKALTGTYATDRAYGDKLIRLIEAYELDRYDREKPEQLELEKEGTSTSAAISTELTLPPYNQVNYDSRNQYAAGNCTQYVYNRITQLGGSIDLDMGNGNQWDNTGRSRNYLVSATPKVGTAACFQRGVLFAHPVYGHVAFVERINPDGSVLLSEMNVLGIGIVSFRTLTAGEAAKLTYITPK